MTNWCELEDETKDGIIFGMELENRLRVDAGWRYRNENYRAAVEKARSHAVEMGNEKVIDLLIADMPSYIRELLETEDERFGSGSLASRYAHTFWKDYK